MRDITAGVDFESFPAGTGLFSFHNQFDDVFIDFHDESEQPMSSEDKGPFAKRYVVTFQFLDACIALPSDNKAWEFDSLREAYGHFTALQKGEFESVVDEMGE